MECLPVGRLETQGMRALNNRPPYHTDHWQWRRQQMRKSTSFLWIYAGPILNPIHTWKLPMASAHYSGIKVTCSVLYFKYMLFNQN